MTLETFNSITSIAALLISIGSVAYVQRREVLQAKWSRTLDLHSEYYSQEFALSRRAAAKFVLDHGDLDWRKQADLGELKQSTESVEALYHVMRFYYRLHILLKNGWLVESQVFPLFGSQLAWWEGLIFKRMRGRKGWQTGEEIEALVNWMNGRAAGDWDKLVARAAAHGR